MSFKKKLFKFSVTQKFLAYIGYLYILFVGFKIHKFTISIRFRVQWYFYLFNSFSILFEKLLPTVQAIPGSFQDFLLEDARPVLMVALAMIVIGQTAVFARIIVAGKDAA